MPGLSYKWICKQTELIAMLYQYATIASQPDKEIKTVHKKKKTPEVPIVALFRSHKGEVHSRSYVAEQIKLSRRSNV